MDTLYERINNECVKLGITGNELGKKLNLKKSPLTDWKNHKSKPTLEQLIKMCDIFAISADYLLFGSQCSYNYTINPIEKELISKYRKLSYDNQEELLAIIELKLQRAQRITGEKSKLSPSQDENARNIIA